MQIGMPQANALILGKSATVFIQMTKNYLYWLPTYLIFSAIDIWLSNI